jgi:V/A-type H+/Na+-transporting ATPase subunit I
MLRPQEMYKLTIFGPKTYMKRVIEELYSMNVVHIEDYSKQTEEEVFEIGEPYEENEKYAELLVNIRSLVSNLNIEMAGYVEPRDTSVEAIMQKTEPLFSQVTSLIRKRDYYTKIKDFYVSGSVKRSLNSMKLTFEEDVDYPNMIHYIGFINGDAGELKSEVDKLAANNVFKTGNFEGVRTIALFVEPGKKDKIEKILEDYEFSPADNPVVKDHYLDLKSKPGHKFVKLNHELEVAEKKIAKVESELAKIKQDNSKFLVEAEKKVRMEVEKAEAPLKLGTTKNTFMLKGWVAVKNSKKLKVNVEQITKGKVLIRFDKPAKGEQVPVAYNHPKVVKSFEPLLELYTRPNYKEIDPTFFMFLTFPIFFGFMLGDVGYGLITMAIFLTVKKKVPAASKMMNAFVLASISTIIFGMVYGEYFGLEYFPENMGEQVYAALPEGLRQSFNMVAYEHHGHMNYPFPHFFHRGVYLGDLLSISIIIGITHILIGLIIGFININRNHGFLHALYEKGGWLMIMPMMIFILSGPLPIITGTIKEMLQATILQLPIAAIAGLFVLGAILVVKGEGVTGVIEVMFFSLMSNILSYARLMAVGLASLSLAVVVNDLAGGMFALGLVGIIPGVLILVAGHTINIALGILSPFLHSIRLHYVEFFGKFYKGGGKKYTTFGYSEE